MTEFQQSVLALGQATLGIITLEGALMILCLAVVAIGAMRSRG